MATEQQEGEPVTGRVCLFAGYPIVYPLFLMVFVGGDDVRRAKDGDDVSARHSGSDVTLSTGYREPVARGGITYCGAMLRRPIAGSQREERNADWDCGRCCACN